MNPETVQQSIDTLIPIVTKYGLQLIGAVLILIVGYFLSRSISKLVGKALTRAEVDVSLIGFTMKLVQVAILGFAIVAALQNFGVQTTSLIAVLGAAGLAIGLALQGSLSNFASGILILLFRPFRVGDWIEAGGSSGKVYEIGILATYLTTGDNQKIFLPNSSVMGNKIVNVNAMPTRRVDVVASVSYDDDLALAKRVLTDILTKHPKVLAEPAPQVELSEMADSSLNFVVRPWVNTGDYWSVRFDVLRLIKEEFDRHGISIPFPQRDVHLHQEAAKTA